uniref:Uncharacterized protein n=1 Tax=Leptobrachium leishanense TaxID=445787 RepID=A0A8C5MWS8_9ANUR
MAHTVLWRIIFISCLIPLISSRDCKWLHPKQEYLSKQILQTFNQMSSLELSFGICPQNVTEFPNIDDLYNITQVEEAATTVREVFNQTIWFYKKHHTDLQCQEKAWERLQALLHYVQNLLDDCIPEDAENSELTHKVSDYFNILEKNDSKCAHNMVHINIKKNLQLASQLSSTMRRRRLLK